MYYLNRRQFLQNASLISLATLFPGTSSWAYSNGNFNSTDNKLIVILLRGAIDGLNIAIPYGDNRYYALRPTIAIPRPGQELGALDLNGYFGLHPALAPILPFWKEKTLAFVHASGSPDPTRSHFDAQDYMETGVPGKKLITSGWLNRLVSELPSNKSPVQALSLGAILPRIFAGSAEVGSAPRTISGNKIVLDRPVVGDLFAQLYSDQNSELGKAFAEGMAAHKTIEEAMAQPDIASNGNLNKMSGENNPAGEQKGSASLAPTNLAPSFASTKLAVSPASSAQNNAEKYAPYNPFSRTGLSGVGDSKTRGTEEAKVGWGAEETKGGRGTEGAKGVREASGAASMANISSVTNTKNAAIEALLAEQKTASRGAPNPKNYGEFGRQLALLMNRDNSIQIAFTDFGGWDTHVNQGAGKGQLANRLEPLAAGLSELVDGLGPLYKKTTIVVMSEFGRTVKENGNNGTDHGHGNAIWLLGGSIHGGKVYGRWADLNENSLYQGRDLPATTDFRDVLCYVLSNHLAVSKKSLANIFPDFTMSAKPLVIT